MLTQDAHQLAARVKQRAREVGFDLCGITTAEPSRHRDYLRSWLDAGHAGVMEYLHRRFDERTDPGAFLPGARSVICVAMNYHVPLEPDDRPDAVRIARYALGQDYHVHVKDRLYAVADWLRDVVPGTLTKCGVDTVPLPERELAARAGVGWVGKNTCVIHERVGSYLFLGEVVTTLALPADAPAVDRCGTCTRCIDACPTGAIVGPYQLDASRCVSYLTIEQAEEVAPELADRMAGWAYGCDVCQEVCPWNRRAATALLPELQPLIPTGTLSADAVAGWSQEDYWAATRGTAMRRVKLPQFKRNAARASLVPSPRTRGEG